MPPVTAITSFFFNDTATTEIYTLSLHDALPISPRHFGPPVIGPGEQAEDGAPEQHIMDVRDHVVGVGLLQLGWRRRMRHPREAGDDEDRNEADGEMQRRRAAGGAAPQRRSPVEDFQAREP